MANRDPDPPCQSRGRMILPSDKVTVNMIRTSDGHGVAPQRLRDIEAMFAMEASIVSAVFTDVRERSRTRSLDVLAPDDFDRLNELYVTYGISSGPTHSRELIRGIQSAAARHAEIAPPDHGRPGVA